MWFRAQLVADCSPNLCGLADALIVKLKLRMRQNHYSAHAIKVIFVKIVDHEKITIIDSCNLN